jgi:hypothetical protein
MTVHVAQILWQAPRLLPLAVVIAIATLVAVLVFYVPQARRLRQPWRWGLPLLRLAVGLALAASVVQPAFVRSESSDDSGAVVLLADASRSMSVVDARTPAERVALANALGALPAGARTVMTPGLEEDLDAMQRRVDELAAARADVEYAKLSGQGVIVAQTRLNEASAQVSLLATQLAQRGRSLPQPSDLATKLGAMSSGTADVKPNDYRTQVAAVRTALAAAQAATDAALYERADVKPLCDEIAKLSRAQLATRALSRTSGGVLASLPANGLYGYTFADTLQPLPGTAAAATQPAMEANGLRSDLTRALRAAADRMKGRAVQAIVVLSDGRQVGGESGVASSLAQGGAPVYAVSVGSSSLRDLAVAEVVIPQRQFVGETTTVRVQLRAMGLAGKNVEVKLDAAEQSAARTVALIGSTTTVEFPLKFDAAATHEVLLSVTPQDGEVTTANNVVRRRVIATSARATVALVGSSASWDFQHLRAALSRAPWAMVEAEVLDAPGARWSVGPADIPERSVIVLSDVAVDHLSSGQWDALYQFVAARGGSVLFVAGRNSASSQFIDSPLLTDLLPFRAGSRPAWRVWPGEQPLFRFQPAAGAADLGPLKLSDGPRTIAEDWLELPAVFQFLPVTELKPNTTPLLVERESGHAVLTDSTLGRGRVLFFGANETWRWRRGANAAEHERFWLQLLRYAVDEPYAVRAGPLWLDADRTSVEPGQSIRVRAKIAHPELPPPSEPTQPLVIARDGKPVAEVALEHDAGTGVAGRYTGVLDNLAPGTYQLQFRDPRDASVVATLPVHVEPDVESEMRDVSTDERTLRRLAEATGGKFLTLAEWDTLPRRLREARQTGRQVEERRLWDSPQLFAFVLGCLGIEWAMRKRLGLA